MPLPTSQRDRALGTLLGVALGDALGMPTQTMSAKEIQDNYGIIKGFLSPCKAQPVAQGLRAACVTDDTEQTLLLAKHLIRWQGSFQEIEWASELLAWEEDVKARNLHDLLGPSTKQALTNHLSGMPTSETGRKGDTNGAAMRIAPIGIATEIEPVEEFVDQVAMTCRITHNTVVAMTSAVAVAAVISAGIDGADHKQAVSFALNAAKEAERREPQKDLKFIFSRITDAIELVDQSDPERVVDMIIENIGTSVLASESIPAAFAVFRLSGGDAWKAGLIAANMGGDTDTIGAIASGMCGACSGASAMPEEVLANLIDVNDLDLDDVVEKLLNLRFERAGKTVELERAI